MKWLVAVIAPVLFTAPVLAEGLYFQDTFDTYGYGDLCPPTGPPQRNQAAFTSAWPIGPGYNCNSLQVDFDYDGMCPDDFRGYDEPFYLEQGKGEDRQNIKNLVPYISDVNASMNAINGSDAEPLVLEVYVHMKSNNQKERATTFWVQLYAADDLAPKNQTLVHDNCVLTNQTASNPHSSIAFGGYPELLPWEPAPQGCDLGYPPLLAADVFYDGDHWTVLEDNVPVPGPALRPVAGRCWWNIAIKTNTVDITVTEVNANGNPLSVVTRTGLPRDYLGPFQGIALGSCEASEYPVYIDHVTLSGGYLTTLDTGACCLADGSCNDVTGEACDPLVGVWNGEGTSCASVTCCPIGWADIDADGDVDQEDFGLWQRCFSGSNHAVTSGCECFDRDNGDGAQGGDGDVDRYDFDWFANCVTGPSVLLNIGNPPPGCIP